MQSPPTKSRDWKQKSFHISHQEMTSSGFLPQIQEYMRTGDSNPSNAGQDKNDHVTHPYNSSRLMLAGMLSVISRSEASPREHTEPEFQLWRTSHAPFQKPEFPKRTRLLTIPHEHGYLYQTRAIDALQSTDLLKAEWQLLERRPRGACLDKRKTRKSTIHWTKALTRSLRHQSQMVYIRQGSLEVLWHLQSPLRKPLSLSHMSWWIKSREGLSYVYLIKESGHLNQETANWEINQHVTNEELSESFWAPVWAIKLILIAGATNSWLISQQIRLNGGNV